jgi:hypothetical protein
MIVPPQRPRLRPVAGRESAPAGLGAASPPVVAFDYGATFAVTGKVGNIVQDVINISADGVFVAVAIGYGFEEDRARSLAVNLRSDSDLIPRKVTLAEIPASALLEGFRVNPRFETLVFGVTPPQAVPRSLLGPLDQETGPTIFERLKAPEEIFFLLSIVDTASGRELQDKPSHNLASLGIGNGQRPFRLLAHPVAFLPRSTIRLQIVEQSQDRRGNLFVVLYGYTLLGASHCPEPVMRRLTGPPACPVETVGSPSTRVIPFDYVTTFELTGQPLNQVEDEVIVSAEGGFVATAISYGLAVPEQKLTVPFARPGLNAVELSEFPPDALRDGIRIRPSHVRLAFESGGALAGNLPSDLASELFERLNRPEDVSFRYTIFDSGRGRELQNQPLHNIAGLGIANGERPFKRLARSMVFLPRSTIRVRVEERFGRGTLFIVFQGYKILGARSATGRR